MIGCNSRIGCFNLGYLIGRFHNARIFAACRDARVEIGNDCEVNGANICARKYIRIGDRAQIASGVQIMDANGHPSLAYDRREGEDTPQPVILGDNVWLGVNAIILKGVEIGDNSIVAAGSVVRAGHYPANSIIAGNPAKVVGTLDFSRDTHAARNAF